MYKCNEIIPSFRAFNYCAATLQVLLSGLSLEPQPLQPTFQPICFDFSAGSESSQGFWETRWQFSPFNALHFLSFWLSDEEINSTCLIFNDLLRLAAALDGESCKFEFQLFCSYSAVLSSFHHFISQFLPLVRELPRNEKRKAIIYLTEFTYVNHSSQNQSSVMSQSDLRLPNNMYCVICLIRACWKASQSSKPSVCIALCAHDKMF